MIRYELNTVCSAKVNVFFKELFKIVTLGMSKIENSWNFSSSVCMVSDL